MSNHILIIEDNASIRCMVEYLLKKEGYSVDAVESAEEGIMLIPLKKPDCILLDINLPGMNGFDFAKEIKQCRKNNDIIIIMLTEKSEAEDIESAFDIEVDDYIPKPFHPKELVARLKARLKRKGSTEEKSVDSIVAGPIKLTAETGVVEVSGKEVTFRQAELFILQTLMQNVDKTLSREEIITFAKGENYAINDRAIDNYIYLIRKKLGDAAAHLETIPKYGYRLKSSLS